MQQNYPGQHKVSVVVPIYNEIEVINAFHRELFFCLSSLNYPFEIIYVDDNSNDGTHEYLSGQAKNNAEVLVIRKIGVRGKAYSLLKGFEEASGDIFVMIDGDLQYPPSEIPAMVKKLSRADVIVSDRRYKKLSLIRKVISKTFRHVFVKTLFGLNYDIQAGLKVFKSEVFRAVKFFPSSAWTFDLEFLLRAKYAGFNIASHPITFARRSGGNSKVELFESIFEIGSNAIKVKMKSLQPFAVPAKSDASMQGAGIGLESVRYITHTILPAKESAFQTFSNMQLILLFGMIGLFILALAFLPLTTARVFITVLSILYFIDTVFNLHLVLKSLKKRQEISFSDEEIGKIDDSTLPVYSILSPLYKEANVVPQFLESIAKLDWPREKLDVLLLLEEDDEATINAVGEMQLPRYVRTIIVPDSQPKTKPKACNYGLVFARGEFLVIYDAEDIPDPLQLKKAYLGFMTLPKDVRCLQAKLNYYNPNQNFLTRFFTAEYSLWFEFMLTGLQSLRSAIPLGGTSNHFHTADLVDLQGWDPFNVTEDADLGVRLFKKGYKTAIIDSTTLEEANSNIGNWFRQRSRWIKGYMQTYLVHTRDPWAFFRKTGLKHTLIFHLTIGAKLLFLLINPFMWVITFLYFALYAYSSSIIELVYYPPISYIAVFSWIFGNFLFIYYYMVACGKRNQWNLVKYVYFIPIYWAMMSYAGAIAFWQLLFKPHYWEKTIHGLHIKSSKPTKLRQVPKASWLSISALGIKALGVACILFFGVDILLLLHLYPYDIAYPYFYLTIIGKGIYVASQLCFFSIFLISRRLRMQVAEKRKVIYHVFSTFFISWIVVLLLGLQFFPILPGFMGMDINSIFFVLPSYTFALMCFSIANIFLIYNLRKRVYVFWVIGYLVEVLLLNTLYLNHANLSAIAQMTGYLTVADVLFIFIFYLNNKYFILLENNLNKKDSREDKGMRILIFNWRDIKHNFAGGAEAYIHEMAKLWVADGNKVTIFCGNDKLHKGEDTLDGVEVVRRGGMYTVYFFAVIYYLFKFRGKYDIIIDCENGIPFFTPLYVRKPIILVIHHIHQDIINKYLRFPLNKIAAVLESKFMPWFYRKKKIVTVSESSKNEILKLGFADEENIEIIYNGASLSKNESIIHKTDYPSFLYLGRLQEYKNIDVAIIAFSRVVKKHKTARLKIVGFGESYLKLKKLAKKLNISESIEFSGKVSEIEKVRFFSEAWVVLQPSQIEGWGITVIEANACGTPVIASRVHGLRDSVVDGRTGILIEKGDIVAFATAMERLIDDSELRQRLSREAYLWSKNFSWSRSAELFYDLIRRSILSPTAKQNVITAKRNVILGLDPGIQEDKI
jgi:cellulose synthase/poly-beta-1,6-N-acetylglucosamine synthase-like glycosyltransferase/glycosyltransferase involved in cell wall biosynthesis